MKLRKINSYCFESLGIQAKVLGVTKENIINIECNKGQYTLYYVEN